MSEPQGFDKTYLKHMVKDLKIYKPTVMDQVEYMRKLYTANLITETDYQDYLKLKLNEVFSSEEQALIWDKINRWEKEKEAWC